MSVLILLLLLNERMVNVGLLGGKEIVEEYVVETMLKILGDGHGDTGRESFYNASASR